MRQMLVISAKKARELVIEHYVDFLSQKNDVRDMLENGKLEIPNINHLSEIDIAKIIGEENLAEPLIEDHGMACVEIQISKINPHLGDETILYPVWDYDNVEPDRRHIFSYGKN